jgi:hypothetical protein
VDLAPSPLPSPQHSDYDLMKVLDIPSSGKRGTVVAYLSPFGLCHRTMTVPANTQTPARQHMRRAFGHFARAWGRTLTQAQRERWNAVGPQVRSAKRLSSGPLNGQLLFQSINSARSRIGLPPLWEPPAPVVFERNPVGPLLITNDQAGLRLRLKLTAPATEDIMVFGQAPCSAGRNKRRNVSYLGLLPPAEDGLCDITALYVARYGTPRPGEKLFIVTRQQKDGWEGYDQETSEIVPEPPTAQPARAAIASTLPFLMHKGCTRDAQGGNATPTQECPKSNKPDPLVETPRSGAAAPDSALRPPPSAPVKTTSITPTAAEQTGSAIPCALDLPENVTNPGPVALNASAQSPADHPSPLNQSVKLSRRKP